MTASEDSTRSQPAGLSPAVARLLPWSARVHVFDVDHTLVRRSTGRRFAQALVRSGHLKHWDLLTLPWHYLRYRLGTINAGELSGRLALIQGLSEAALQDAARSAHDRYGIKDVFHQARRYVELLHDQERPIVLASTSVRVALEPLAHELGIQHLLGSELEFHRGNATGRLVGEPCYGPHKVARVGALLNELGFTFADAAFYSDSIHDRFLLSAVGYPVAVRPDARLRSLAQSYGWPVVWW